MRNTNGQLEQRIDDLVRGVLLSAREVALAAVAEAFVRNEEQVLGARLDGSGEIRRSAPARRRKRGPSPRRVGQKRSPEELTELGEKLCEAICKKPGETMRFYAAQVASTPLKLTVPVRRLVEEERVHAIGDRNQRRYYAGARA